jgi:hypothetical protein
VGGCDRGRHPSDPRRRRTGLSRPPLQLPLLRTAVRQRHCLLQRLPRLRPQPRHRLDQHPLPNTALPNGIIAAYWDDLDPSLNGGAIWHRTTGTAPNRKLVISWIGVRHADTPGPISFQAVLEESTNDVLLAYQDTLHGNPAQDHGASATVGIESPDGTQGSQFLHNQPLLAPYQATTSLRYTNR